MFQYGWKGEQNVSTSLFKKIKRTLKKPFDLALTAHLNGLNMSNVVHELFLYA